MKEERIEVNSYEAPRVEVVEVKIERGFAASVGVGGVGVGGWDNGYIGGGEANEMM